MLWFTLITTVAVLLLMMAGIAGGAWVLVSFIYLTIFTYFMDRLIQRSVAYQDSDGEFPAGHNLSAVLGLAHCVLLVVGVWAISGAGNHSIWERGLCFISFGIFFGQISNANAHELIHRSARWPRRLGVLVYTTLLFGHHASAHPKVHHIWAASDMDPNSAPVGQSVYQFLPRAWAGSFVKGWRAETQARQKAHKPMWSHPYLAYIGGALGTIWLACVTLGLPGLGALILLTGYAQMQLLISDYVQHYGLRRIRDATGRLESIKAHHSWNAPHFYSSALMLNAPRHSDHHLHPSRSYPALTLTQDMPTLPRPLPFMGVVALFPPLWRRMMDQRLAKFCKS